MDFYELLGVAGDATPEDIKRAYRRLARRFHPDINPGDRAAAVRFGQIAEAYETLVDPDRRRRYDEGGRHELVSTATFTFGFEGFDFSVETVHGAATSSFGDLFGDVLQRPAVEGQPVRGADLHATVSVTFEESVRGTERQITMVRREGCRACGGSGRQRTAESRCPACAGSGRVQSTRGHMVFAKACDRCHGAGHVSDVRCPTCNGQGIESRSEIITVPIPAGVADGDRVSVAAKGHVGTCGGPAGDLIALVQVAAHPIFRRQGQDLHLVVPVAIHEAALGVKIEIPTFDGPARLRIPPGTQSGQRFRLRDRGVLSPRDGRRGDLVAEVRLVLPPLLDERSKELLREFGRINNVDVRKGLTV
jgi:molecular chaperone DnaJ